MTKGPKQGRGHSLNLFGVFTLEEGEGHVQKGGIRQLENKEGSSKAKKKDIMFWFGEAKCVVVGDIPWAVLYAKILFSFNFMLVCLLSYLLLN